MVLSAEPEIKRSSLTCNTAHTAASWLFIVKIHFDCDSDKCHILTVLSQDALIIIFVFIPFTNLHTRKKNREREIHRNTKKLTCDQVKNGHLFQNWYIPVFSWPFSCWIAEGDSGTNSKIKLSFPPVTIKPLVKISFGGTTHTEVTKFLWPMKVCTSVKPQLCLQQKIKSTSKTKKHKVEVYII